MIVLFSYNYLQNSGEYRRTLQSELNPIDFHIPGNQISEIAETYSGESNFYHANILKFSEESLAIEGITALKENYNSGMIVFDKKYINYVELAPQSHYYFYKSGKSIITIDFNGEKADADNFVLWYISKHPNK